MPAADILGGILAEGVWLHPIEPGLFSAATPGARLFFTALVQSGQIADRYLRMWAEAGELFERTASELQAAFDEIAAVVDCRLAGNLALLRCRKRE